MKASLVILILPLFVGAHALILLTVWILPNTWIWAENLQKIHFMLWNLSLYFSLWLQTLYKIYKRKFRRRSFLLWLLEILPGQIYSHLSSVHFMLPDCISLGIFGPRWCSCKRSHGNRWLRFVTIGFTNLVSTLFRAQWTCLDCFNFILLLPCLPKVFLLTFHKSKSQNIY